MSVAKGVRSDPHTPYPSGSATIWEHYLLAFLFKGITSTDVLEVTVLTNSDINYLIYCYIIIS